MKYEWIKQLIKDNYYGPRTSDFILSERLWSLIKNKLKCVSIYVDGRIEFGEED